MWTETEARSNESSGRKKHSLKLCQKFTAQRLLGASYVTHGHVRVGWRSDTAQRPTKITRSLLPHRKIYSEMHFQSLAAHRENCAPPRVIHWTTPSGTMRNKNQTSRITESQALRENGRIEMDGKSSCCSWWLDSPLTINAAVELSVVSHILIKYFFTSSDHRDLPCRRRRHTHETRKLETLHFATVCGQLTFSWTQWTENKAHKSNIHLWREVCYMHMWRFYGLQCASRPRLQPTRNYRAFDAMHSATEHQRRASIVRSIPRYWWSNK